MKGAAGDLRRDQPRRLNHKENWQLKHWVMQSPQKKVNEGIAVQWSSNLANRQEAWPRDNVSGESTDKAQPGDGENLKETQEQLNEMIEELLEDIDQTARAMGGFNENATEDLLKEAKSQEGGIERSGKRAENSLLMKRFLKRRRRG